MKYHGKSGRKKSGGRRHPYRKKKKFELGGEPIPLQIGERKIKKVRTRGGNQKIKLYRHSIANVTDPKTGETKPVEIEGVVENPANVYFVRKGIITKGAIIKTKIGNALVTSRPGQDGVINAVLLER
jgi:small subunit ribosomal protein S8e